MKKVFLLLPAALLLVSCDSTEKSPLGTQEETLALIRQVNDAWQAAHSEPANAFWHPAAYHTGNMAAYAATGEERYRAYSEEWAEHNQWMGAKSPDPTEWKYSYGETDEYVLFGDWQTCFQVYVDLDRVDPDNRKIARAREVMEYQMATPQNDYWWWADGIYMAMPVMTRLHKVTGDPLYLEKMYDYFSFARDMMYDGESRLFYRDAKYIYPEHKTANGGKDFWARGNGWVFAAYCRVLDDLPEEDPHREEYIRLYQEMAGALIASQQEEGYWTRSMLDPEQAPGPETSGTAFFTYGFLWGINNGLLNKDNVLPTVEKAWAYLTRTALQPDGTLGYVQPIGERAIPGQTIDARSTADFGVGAFLLAASELVKYLE